MLQPYNLRQAWQEGRKGVLLGFTVSRPHPGDEERIVNAESDVAGVVLTVYARHVVEEQHRYPMVTENLNDALLLFAHPHVVIGLPDVVAQLFTHR